MRTKPSIILTICAAAFSVSVAAQIFPPVVNEGNLRDAILGTETFSTEELADLDVNFDGRVDVADLIVFINSSGTAELEGFKWLVFASFDSTDTAIGGLGYNYAFVLSVEDAAGMSSTIDEFDPTKDLLGQGISGPGELPGANRPDYLLSPIVPDGTTFSKSSNGSVTTLISSAQVVAANDATNPTGSQITRTWSLNIDEALLFSNSFVHGSITESTDGFLPGSGAAVAVGDLTLVRYSPIDLEPLESP